MHEFLGILLREAGRKMTVSTGRKDIDYDAMELQMIIADLNRLHKHVQGLKAHDLCSPQVYEALLYAAERFHRLRRVQKRNGN